MDENPPPEYLKGFNNGYTIAEHYPELAEQLKSIKGDMERMQGMRAGIEQYGLDKGKSLNRDTLPEWLKPERPQELRTGTEKGKDIIPSWLQPGRLSSLNRDNEQNKDKDAPDKA